MTPSTPGCRLRHLSCWEWGQRERDGCESGGREHGPFAESSASPWRPGDLTSLWPTAPPQHQAQQRQAGGLAFILPRPRPGPGLTPRLSASRLHAGCWPRPQTGTTGPPAPWLAHAWTLPLCVAAGRHGREPVPSSQNLRESRASRATFTARGSQRVPRAAGPLSAASPPPVRRPVHLLRSVSGFSSRALALLLCLPLSASGPHSPLRVSQICPPNGASVSLLISRSVSAPGSLGMSQSQALSALTRPSCGQRAGWWLALTGGGRSEESGLWDTQRCPSETDRWHRAQVAGHPAPSQQPGWSCGRT